MIREQKKVKTAAVLLKLGSTRREDVVADNVFSMPRNDEGATFLFTTVLTSHLHLCMTHTPQNTQRRTSLYTNRCGGELCFEINCDTFAKHLLFFAICKIIFAPVCLSTYCTSGTQYSLVLKKLFLTLHVRNVIERKEHSTTQ